jgi:hypothetical protein
MESERRKESEMKSAKALVNDVAGILCRLLKERATHQDGTSTDEHERGPPRERVVPRLRQQSYETAGDGDDKTDYGVGVPASFESRKLIGVIADRGDL